MSEQRCQKTRSAQGETHRRFAGSATLALCKALTAEYNIHAEIDTMELFWACMQNAEHLI